MRTALLAVALVLAAGCGSVGPVVVDVSSDGAGRLVAQRCEIYANFMFGFMRLRDCKFDEVRVAPKPPKRSSWTFTPDGKPRPPDEE